jgi:hypothetical protein
MSQARPLSSISFFISSTYVDMREHRDAVIKNLQTKAGIINAQEFFGSRDKEPLATCLDEVTRSDVFLLFLGPRYGSVHPDSGKSFVECEYDKACELGLPRFAYIIDDAYSFPIEHVSVGEDASRLKEFKVRVRGELTVSTFTTPSDLAAKAFSDLMRELPGCGFNIGAENETAYRESNLETLRQFTILPKLFHGRTVEFTCSLSEPMPATQNQCDALSYRHGETVACDIRATDDEADRLIRDYKIKLYGEGRNALSLIEIPVGKPVICEARTIQGTYSTKIPYYGFEYELGLSQMLLASHAGRKRVIVGFENTLHLVLGLEFVCIKDIA